MTEVTGGDITHLAKLARIKLSKDEQEKFAAQLPKIVEFVEQLRQVELDESISEDLAIDQDTLRADEVSGKRLVQEDLQKLAPDNAWRDGYLTVPAVFGEAEDA